jgi:phosphoglycerate dehydrogenase-like enzyme
VLVCLLPLSPDGPFWTLPQVFVTPHCAADVQPARPVALLLESRRRLEAGLSLVGEVDLSAGY